jgi:hypothetical protein
MTVCKNNCMKTVTWARLNACRLVCKGAIIYMLWGPTGTGRWATPGLAMALSHHLAMFGMRGVRDMMRQFDRNLFRSVNTAVLA